MSTRRQFLAAAPVGMLTALSLSCTSSGAPSDTSSAPNSQPTSQPQPVPENTRAKLAPGGVLRVGLNVSNTLLVSTLTPEPAGVAPDLGRELARRANARVTFVTYANAGLVADAAAGPEWDVAFIGADPERAAAISFTPAYVGIESTYLVRNASPFRSIADVDREGVRIVSAERAAYTLHLQRALQHATLVEVDGIANAATRFTTSPDLDALAGLRAHLQEHLDQIPDSRLLDGAFTTVQQAAAIPKARTAAADYLVTFLDEIKRSGLLASLIERHGITGLTIL